MVCLNDVTGYRVNYRYVFNVSEYLHIFIVHSLFYVLTFTSGIPADLEPD